MTFLCVAQQVISCGTRYDLEPVPIQVLWVPLIVAIGLAIAVSSIGILILIREIAKIDPNAVLRDNGTP